MKTILTIPVWATIKALFLISSTTVDFVFCVEGIRIKPLRKTQNTHTALQSQNVLPTVHDQKSLFDVCI